MKLYPAKVKERQMQVIRKQHFCLLKILPSDVRLIVDPARSISPARCGVEKLALDSPTPLQRI
jgi:hypothetical protein